MEEKLELGSSSEVAVSECHMLDRAEIEHYWSQVALALDAEPELWQFSFTKDDILAGLFAGTLQLWSVSTKEIIHLLFMTQCYTTVAGINVAQVWWCYGEGLADKMPLIDLVLDSFAATRGCARVEGQGRDGFGKLVKNLGYRKDYSVWSRPVRAQRGN